MHPDLTSYLERQKARLVAEAPGFIAAIQGGGRPLGDGKDDQLAVFNEIDVLLAMLNGLDAGDAVLDQATVHDCLLRSLTYAFELLDERGFIAGWDIDGKPVSGMFFFWGNLLCLVAFEELGSEYAERLRPFIRRTRAGVECVKDAIARYASYETKAYRGLNLLFLDIVTLYQAGRYFDEPAWQEIATRASERLMLRFDAQEGFLPDSRDEDADVGPSSTYFLFSLFTASYFCRYLASQPLVEALQRSIDWHLRMSFPNGQPLDIADERGRLYAGTEVEKARSRLFCRSPLLLCSAGGRALVQHWESVASTPYALGVVANDLNFFAAIAPELVEAMDRPGSAWFATAPSGYHRQRNGKSAILKTGDWVFAFHGYLSGPLDPKGMWHRELQQHFSVYYHGIANLLGGGNSLGQAEFSTFRTSTSHLCDRVEILPRDGHIQCVVLSNDGWQAMLSIACDGGLHAEITFEVTRRGVGEAWLQIPVVGYSSRKQLLIDGTAVTSFDESPASGVATANATLHGTTDRLAYEVAMRFSTPANYRWPVLPVNVRLPGIPPLPLTEAVTLLSFPMHQSPRVAVTLDIITTARV